MLTVVSDTHGSTDARLRGRTREAVRGADLVIHAGDFTAVPVLDAFEDASQRLVAVHGNADDPAVRERIPAARTVEYGGVRIAVTHTRRGGATALSMFGRERGADVVVFGHTHRPTVVEGRGVTLCNPGSHADPRGNRPGHIELDPDEGGLDGRLRSPDGAVLERFRVARRSE